MDRMSTLQAAVLLALPASAIASEEARPTPETALAGVGLVLVGLASLTALEVLVLALLPAAVGRARGELARRSGRCFAAGVLVLLVGFGVAAALSQAGGVGSLLAVLIAAALVLAVVLGLPAIASLVGDAVLRMSGNAPAPLAAAVWGLVIVFAASMLPVLGWALFVFLCITALGAVALALLSRRQPPAAVPEVEPPSASPGP